MIVLLESLHPEAEELLERAAPVVRVEDPNGGPQASWEAEQLAQVTAILTRGRGRIQQDWLRACPALKVIARAGAGLDNLDTGAAKARGIQVLFAPGRNTNTVAEHSLSLMLDLARGVSRSAASVRAGHWEQRADYRGIELYERTLGILGYGSIGRRVAELAQAFGMNVLVGASLRLPGSRDGEARLPLHELLPRVDVLSLHLPLTPETRGCLGAEQLQLLPKGALVVNTARGALIDGLALRSALDSGHLGGYAADVLEVEPPDPTDPLVQDERVVLTPHVASLTAGAYRDLCCYTAQNVLRVLSGKAPAAESIYLR